MTHFILRKSLLLLLVCSIAMSCKENESADLVLSNINIIDVEQGIVVEYQDVLIEGHSIKNIVEHGKANVKADRVVDGTGKYLIPGLWDMHSHFRTYSHADNLPMYLLYGVTGVRDLGLTNYDLIKRWKKQIASDEIAGPRIISSGVIIEGNSPRFRSSVVITRMQDVIPTLDSLIGVGVDMIKVFENIPKDVYIEILRYCKAKSLPTAGHIPSDMNQITASESGLGSIEHFWGIDKTFREYDSLRYTNQEIDSLANVLVEHDTYECPTLVNSYLTFVGTGRDSAYQASDSKENELTLVPNYFKAWWMGIRANLLKTHVPADLKRFHEMQKLNAEIIKKLHDRGVKILAGTDTPNPYVIPGISLHEELIELVKAGLTPTEALKAATLYPAQYFKQTDKFGIVAKDFLADLVILDANPLKIIANTQKINAVIYDGKYLSKDELTVLKSNQLRKISTSKMTDFDQFIYMDVRKFGLDVMKSKYPNVKSSDRYTIEKNHLVRLSNALSEGLEPEEAMKALQWNLSIFPDDDLSYIEIGKLYIKQTDSIQAISYLEKAIALNPGNQEAGSLLSSLKRR